MPGNKRERELARAKYERQQARRREEASKRRARYQVVAAVAVAVVVIAGFAGFALHQSSNASAAAASSVGATPTASTTPSTASASPTASLAAVIPTDGSAAQCTYRASGTPARAVTLPSTSGPTRPATRTLRLSLNGKVVTISLLASKAPCTVNSFVHLSAANFFTNTPCHRLTTGALAVLQCGDPTGTGSSGPGYQFNDENLAGATYPAGTVAMANSGPNTNGSQFFLVYANSTLPSSYTPFGTVVAGMDVLTAIGQAGVKGGGTDGAPANPVTITAASVGS